MTTTNLALLTPVMGHVNLISLFLAVFILGMITQFIWRKSGRGRKLIQRSELVLGSFFTLVAVLVTGNLVYLSNQFNQYVDETAVRDYKQEVCGYEATRALTAWANSLNSESIADRNRDKKLIEITGKPGGPTAEDWASLNLLFDQSLKAREQFSDTVKMYPIPLCDPPKEPKP
jgi:hypothetical protein